MSSDILDSLEAEARTLFAFALRKNYDLMIGVSSTSEKVYQVFATVTTDIQRLLAQQDTTGAQWEEYTAQLVHPAHKLSEIFTEKTASYRPTIIEEEPILQYLWEDYESFAVIENATGIQYEFYIRHILNNHWYVSAPKSSQSWESR